MKKINTNLQIKTNLDANGADDLQFEVNFDYANNKYRDGRQIFVDNSGMIYIGREALMERKKVFSRFQDQDQQNELKKYFATHSEISWNDLFVDEDANRGKYAPFISSYQDDFRKWERDLRSELIPLAADDGSACEKLILGRVLVGWAVKYIKDILGRSGSIHGFDLQVDDARKIYDCVMKYKTSEWKHKLEINNGVLRIVNGVNVPEGGTEAITISITRGTGSADAGEIVQAAQDGGISELEVKSY